MIRWSLMLVTATAIVSMLAGCNSKTLSREEASRVLEEAFARPLQMFESGEGVIGGIQAPVWMHGTVMGTLKVQEITGVSQDSDTSATVAFKWTGACSSEVASSSKIHCMMQVSGCKSACDV